jgi:hypothetical protein
MARHYNRVNGQNYGSMKANTSTPPASHGTRDKGVELYPDTNMYPARSTVTREQASTARVRGIFATNVWAAFRGPNAAGVGGLKPEQAAYDLSHQAYLHKDANFQNDGMQQIPAILAEKRINDHVTHSALIRPAAPAQVSWKVAYVQGERNVQPIGPYNTQSQKSILSRVSTILGNMGKGS